MTKQAIETEIRIKTTGVEGIKGLGEALDDVGNEAKKAVPGTVDLKSAVSELVKVSAGLFALEKIREFAADLVGVAAQYGKLEANLNTVTGSADEASTAFARIRDFQATAPIFSVEKVTEAFILLKNLGLDPSERALRAYGNTSAATGKDILQFVEAVADAATGEFERLKEFGIKAGAQGDKVVLQFQGGQKIIENSAQAISDALIEIGETTFGRGIENQSKEIAGSIGEIAQAWENLKLELANDAGFKSIFGFIAAGIRQSATTFKALEDPIGKNREELQRIHDALIVMLGDTEQGSLRWENFQRHLRGVNAELAKLEAAGTKEVPFQAALPGLSADAEKLVRQFGALTASGKSTAEALKGIGQSLKPGDTNSIRAYGQAIEELRISGKATGTEVRDAIDQITKGLDAEDLRQFSANLQEALGGDGLRDAQALSAFLDSVLREAFKRLGVDAETALTGISQPVGEALDNLQTLQTTLEATGADAKDVGDKIALALEQISPKAETRGDIEAIRSAIEALGNEGTLSTRQLAEAEAELTAQLREVEAQETKNNAVLQEAIRTQSEAVQAAERETTAIDLQAQKKTDEARLRYEAAKASGDEKAAAAALIQLKAAEAAQSKVVAQAKADEAETAKYHLQAIIAEAEADGTLTEAEQAIIDAAQEVVDTKTAEAEAAKTSAAEKEIEVTATEKQIQASQDQTEATKGATKANKDLADTQDTVVTTTFASAKAAEKANQALAAMRTGLGSAADAWVEFNAIQKIAADSMAQLATATALQERLQAAAESGIGLVDAIAAADREFNLLDENQLSGLQSALDSVQSKLEQLRASSESALEAQIREANTLAGNEAGNQVLDDQNSRRELAAQLAEAQAAGDGESVRNLKQAQALLEANIETRRSQQAENIQALERQADVAAKSGDKKLQEFFNYSIALRTAGNTLAEAIDTAAQSAVQSLRSEAAAFNESIAAIRANVADFGAGIDDSIRELKRGTLSESESEADKLAEINEKLAKAKKLAQSGQTEEAKALRDEIVSLGKSLAKSGDKASTDTAIGILEQAKSLNEKIGSAEEVAAEQLHALKVANIEAEKQAAITAANEAYDTQIEAAKRAHDIVMQQIAQEAAARKASGAFVIDNSTRPYAGAVDSGGGSGESGSGQTSNPADVQREGDTHNPFPGSGFASGGPIFSGHLPGYGGGDRRPILAEDGEFVQRKEAVAHYGIPLMEAINQMRLPRQGFALGGPIALPTQKLAKGGPIVPDMIIELRGPGSTASAGKFPRRSATDELLHELGKSSAVRAGR